MQSSANKTFPRPVEKIAILAPTGQDATLIATALQGESVRTEILDSIESVCVHLASGSVAALLIAEEALTADGIERLNRALGAQEPWSDVPVILMTSSGETTLATLRIKRAFSPAGNLNLLERPFRRITLQSTVQVALRARQRQHQVRDLLEKQALATQARDEFISIASHELKTPLTSLKLQTQLSQRRMASGDAAAFDPVRTQMLVESTAKQVDRLARLVEDMLDISRINLGKLRIQPEDFDLSSMVQETVERTQPQLDAAKCRISVSVAEPIVGHWDRFRIEQIVTNLLSNAVRYCPGTLIEVTVSRDSTAAIVKVRDQGPGIARENLNRIFERFERAVSGHSISGLGLGLYICREIAEAHGGSITVESELGRGSTFTLSLPFKNG